MLFGSSLEGLYGVIQKKSAMNQAFCFITGLNEKLWQLLVKSQVRKPLTLLKGNTVNKDDFLCSSEEIYSLDSVFALNVVGSQMIQLF